MTSRLNKRIAFIGAGQMSEALVSGLLRTQTIDAGSIFATDPERARREHFAAKFAVRTGTDNREAVEWADIVVLAVKPQALLHALDEAGGIESRLVVSVVAGVPIARLMDRLEGRARIARIMPNAPVLVGEGMSALTFGPGTTEDDRGTVRAIFESVGRVAVVDESLLDAVTGLSGSGPAYVCLACEALADGGVKMGLSREAAMALAVQTLYGAAKTVVETLAHPGDLKDRVASPAGTTIAGVHVLERFGFRATLMAAVQAAANRADEMGRACSS